MLLSYAHGVASGRAHRAQLTSPLAEFSPTRPRPARRVILFAFQPDVASAKHALLFSLADSFAITIQAGVSPRPRDAEARHYRFSMIFSTARSLHIGHASLPPR